MNQLVSAYLKHGNYHILTADIVDIKNFLKDHKGFKVYLKTHGKRISTDSDRSVEGFMQQYPIFICRIDRGTVEFFFTRKIHGAKVEYSSGISLPDIYQ